MTRYARLCPPPWCRVVIRPWLLRPPFLGSGLTNDFSGVDRVISMKSATLEPRRPGVVGLYLRIPIIYFLVKVVSAYESGPPKMSIVPSLRLTMARLVLLRVPQPNLVRLRLPARLMVLIDSTLTEKIFSTASLISALFERGSTRKVYLPSSIRPYLFSETTGASTTSRGSLMVAALTWHPPRSLQPCQQRMLRRQPW